jgi:predicted short-subunit dehydrogenase-like oxidoreductase (DUF2520 family)
VTVVGIVGPGRAGVGLGSALSRAGYQVFLHGRQAKNLPVSLEHTWGGTPPWIAAVDIMFLAVPDDAIYGVARELQSSQHVSPHHAVLHLSGVLGRTALTALEPSGASLGSFHPVQSLHDPLTAPEQLKGSIAVVEGDEAAVRLSSELGRSVGLHLLRVSSEQKAMFHAAEVFLSSFVVVLAAEAERLLRDAGASPVETWRALSPVLAGTLESLRARGTAKSFGGPVARGEERSVQRHLEVLAPESRTLYRALTRRAIEIADLSSDVRESLEAVLAEAEEEAGPPR